MGHEDHRSASPSYGSSAVSEPACPLQNRFEAGSSLYFPTNGVENLPELNENGEAEVDGAAIGHLRFVDEAASGGLEWKDVEARFDRIANIKPGQARAISAADFGFCIGMQKSAEFANELLAALRGRKDLGAEITKAELQKHWHRLTNPLLSWRVQTFFDLCDRDMDGRISHMELKQAVLLSSSCNKLSVTQKEAEQHAALIMEELDTESRGYIQVGQLEALFKQSISKDHLSTGPNSSRHARNYPYQEPASTAEILFRTYWRRGWMIMLWLLVCIALFAWKFTQYRHRKAFEVMGYCLCTAKGAAETLKFNMALVLLPVCRNTLTWLRKHRQISSVIPFNDNINFHKLIAGGIVVGVILHGGTHLACDFPRISGSDNIVFQQTIAARFGYHQPSYLEILATTEAATGIAMVILMAISFSLATKWPRRRSPSLPRSIRQVTGFNTFWYSHHLFILVYALLLIHSMFLFLTSDAAEKTTWMYIAIPVLLYASERISRAIRSEFRDVKILKATIFQGKVLSLTMSRPEGFKYRSGMYIYIQCPKISPFEWHPFSLTSGPEDDHLSIHIRALGDWSYQMYSLFQEVIISAGPMEYPRIYVDGPYGAASQDCLKYDILVFVGLGIGVTPFISILKGIFKCLQKPVHGHHCVGTMAKCPSNAYLYWVTREQCSLQWFGDVMKEISSRKEQDVNVIEMHNFLTGAYQAGDARSALLSAIQALCYAKNGIDIVSHTRVQTHFGRPNWPKMLSTLARRHEGARIGVFYCGPLMLARELEALCTKFSTKCTTRFVFHKENY
ncbi:respiratory burst oxidase homolog protein F-like [Diospyros lotus]|uniref:respiratory burst oxidase homolog protein F-like n=1 Tax=Diospyros lotus TaxID=55363 RepID=UPI002257B13E|nr:respiratory burst oxidase homolog protein F-like [Diospyros lotus]